MKKTIGNLTVKFGADTKQFTNQMKRARRQTNSLSKGFNRLGGMIAGAFSIYAAGSIIKNAIRKNIEFEKAMADVQAITKATGEQLDALSNDAKKLGASTEHTASAVARLQKEFGKLGFSTQEILDATGATLDLATATGEELAMSAEVAGATIRGFGLDAKETRRVVDLMAASFTSSALDLTRFSESMKYVAPIARAAGIDIETATAHMSALADAGIHGSMAGTALKRIYSELSDTGKTMAEVLNDLSKESIGLSEAENLVKDRAKAALLVLTNNTGKVNDLKDAYDKAGGSAKNMADIQRNTLSGSIAKLQSAYEGLILKLEKGNSVLKKTVDLLTEMMQGIGGEHGNWEVMVDGFLRKMPLNMGEKINLHLALLQKKVFGNVRPLEALEDHLANKWRSINDQTKQSGDELAGMTEAALKGQIVAYETQVSVYEGLIKKHHDNQNQEKEKFYWHQAALADKEIKKLEDELERREEITDKEGDNVENVTEEYHSWTKSLAELKGQITENNKAIQESLDLDEVQHLLAVNAQLKEQIESRERLVGLRRAENSAVPDKAPQRKGEVSGGSVIPAGSDHPTLFEGFREQTETTAEVYERMVDRMQAAQQSLILSSQETEMMVENAVGNMAAAFGNAISDMIAGDEAAGKTLFKNIIGIIAQFMDALGQAMIAAGIASEAFKNLLGSGVGAIVAGVALVAAAGVVRGLISNTPEMADGGIASGPTLAMVGEYSGARGNPEVISPLNKLKDMMSMGSQRVEVVGRIRGTDLKLVMDKYNDKVDQYT